MTIAGRKRLTRAESQERTRALIVDAAAQLFLEKGFTVTSLEQVGEAAGFTRGAVYSNFTDKTAMGIAVVDELYRREEVNLLATVDSGPRERVFDLLSEWADATIGNPSWIRLELELAAHSAHNDEHRAATAARYERLRALCRTLIDRFLDESVVVDRDMLAIALVGIGLGVGVQRGADPSIAGSRVSDFVRTLLQNWIR